MTPYLLFIDVVLGLWLCWLSRGWDFLRELLKCCEVLHQMLHLPLRGNAQKFVLLVIVRGYAKGDVARSIGDLASKCRGLMLF